MRKVSLLMILSFLYFSGAVNAAIELKWSATAGEIKKIDDIIVSEEGSGFFAVDWGAGDEENMAKEYEYLEAGDYTVTIAGEIVEFKLTDGSNSGVKSIKITEEDNYLERLNIWWNPQLADLDIKNAKNLKRIDMTGNSLETLDISANLALEHLDMKMANIEFLELAEAYPVLSFVDMNSCGKLSACEQNKLFKALPEVDGSWIINVGSLGDFESDPDIARNKGWFFPLNSGNGTGINPCDGSVPNPDEVDFTIEFTFLVEEGAETKTIPVIAGWAAINWGDGTIEPVSGSATHTYAAPGEYTVFVGGVVALKNNASMTSLKVIKEDLNLLALDIWSNSDLTEIDVKNAKNLMRLDVSRCGVSNVDITQNTKLQVLELKGSQIETISVAEVYPLMRWVDINTCGKFEPCEINKLWISLPDYSDISDDELGFEPLIHSINALGDPTSDSDIAKNKRWRFGNGGDGDGSAECETAIIETPAAKLIVHVADGIINVKGLEEKTQVNVYTTTGVLLASKYALDTAQFKVAPGIYIVRAGSAAKMVMVTK